MPTQEGAPLSGSQRLELVPVTGPDLPLLEQFVRAYCLEDGHTFHEDRQPAALAALVAGEPLGRAWLIRLDGRPVGYVVLSWSFSVEAGGHEACVDELYLVPEVRNQGLGSRALAMVESEARDLAVQRIFLEVQRGNRMIGLYRRAGYVDHDRFLTSKILTRDEVSLARRLGCCYKPGDALTGIEMSHPHDDRIILTPGPVTTSPETKRAMLRDFSPNEPDLLALTAEMRERLLAIVNGQDRYVCVPLQGVGNTANEATLGTLVPRERRLLIVSNGFYGERLKQIAGAIGLPFAALDLPWTEPASAERLERTLAADGAISHVVVCHVDTGTGLVNRLEPLAEVARRRGVALIVDAIASFGGLPIDARALDLEAVVASPNKWLEGVPGIGLVLAKRAALENAAGRAHSFCLDLHRQWRSFEHDGRWRFTPPTQATAALVAALRQHAKEGQAVRLERVRRNWRCLVDGLRALGFETYLQDQVASPVIATFHAPVDPRYDRERLFELMWQRGFVMFRGQLTPEPTFRIGCMGAIDEAVMRRVVEGVGESMAAMGVRDCRPAHAPAAAE